MTRQSRQGGESRETFKVRIPPGVREGQRLRVPAKGDPGMGNGGAGDLFLNVRLAPHPLFRVNGADLVHDLELAPWEAVLGARVRAPTIDGQVAVRVPAGTQAGTQLRVRGRGLPEREGRRGDLLLQVTIVVPDKVSEADRKLWDQLAEQSSFSPRG
jgi:curved DNA-binding protein